MHSSIKGVIAAVLTVIAITIGAITVAVVTIHNTSYECTQDTAVLTIEHNTVWSLVNTYCTGDIASARDGVLELNGIHTPATLQLIPLGTIIRLK